MVQITAMTRFTLATVVLVCAIAILSQPAVANPLPNPMPGRDRSGYTRLPKPSSLMNKILKMPVTNPSERSFMSRVKG